MLRKYALPAFLIGTVEQAAYQHWLEHKARTHVRRDRKRGTVIGEAYRVAIHAAVATGGGRDAYTGEALDWSLLLQRALRKAACCLFSRLTD